MKTRRRHITKRPLQKAVDTAGSMAELARRIGGNVQRQHVWIWLEKNEGRVPAEHCRAIEDATAGAVTRHDLRPDIFDPPNGRTAA